MGIRKSEESRAVLGFWLAQLEDSVIHGERMLEEHKGGEVLSKWGRDQELSFGHGKFGLSLRNYKQI